MKKKTANRVTETLLETAKDMHALGVFNDAEYTKITMRHVGKKKPATAKPLSGDQIRALRERSRMSQAVFGMTGQTIPAGETSTLNSPPNSRNGWQHQCSPVLSLHHSAGEHWCCHRSR